MIRWVTFFIAIVIGLALGLAYGWLINPVEYVDTSPDTLRIDYKTDFVLMVAEAYHNDMNLALAVHRLAQLGNSPPNEITTQAINFANEAGYLESDIILMQQLLDALEVLKVIQGTPAP